MKPLDGLRLVWSARHEGKGIKGGAALICASSLSPTERGVLTSLIRRRNDKTGRCDPGVRTLAEDTGMSVQGVRDVLDRLEAAGLVKLDRTPGRSTRYEIHLAPLAELCKSLGQCKSLVLCKQLGRGVQASSTALCKPLAPNCLELPDELPPPTGEVTAEPSPPRRKAAKGRQPAKTPSWVQTAVQTFEDVTGGMVAHGKVGKALKPLVAKHPEAEVLARWRTFLEGADDVRFATPAKFAEVYGTVGKDGRRKGRHHEQLDDGPRAAEGGAW